MTVVARRVRTVHDVELLHLGRTDHVPFRREIPAVAEEVRDEEAVDEDDGARALHGVGAAQCDHRVVIPGEAFADEEVRRVLHQVFDIERIDRFELLRTQRDRQPSGHDGHGCFALTDDEDGLLGDGWIGRISRRGRGGQRRRGQRQ